MVVVVGVVEFDVVVVVVMVEWELRWEFVGVRVGMKNVLVGLSWDMVMLLD